MAIRLRLSGSLPETEWLRSTLAPALAAPRLLGLLARPMAMAFAQVATQAHPVWQCMSGQRLRLHWWLRGYWGFLRIRWRWHLRKLQRRLTLYGSACQANTCTCTSGTAAARACCASDSDSMCASCNAGFTLYGNHVRPTPSLAPHQCS